MSDINDMKDVDLMGEDEDLLDSVVTLTDDEGNEVAFELLDFVELEGRQFVVLLPVEDPDEEGTVVILEVDQTADNEDPETETYISVEDEEILNKVFAIFRERFEDEFDFED